MTNDIDAAEPGRAPDPDLDLAGRLPVDAGHLARLHDRMVERADLDGDLDLAYRTVDSPIGELLLAATPRGLIRVAFASEGFDRVLGVLAERVSPRILRSPRRLDRPALELQEYFAGRRRRFDVELDRSLSTGFRGRVHHYLSTIGYGEVASYRDVAAGVDNPTAIRAVGTACGTNPLPIVVPCHRVLRSDGTLGGYLGGLPAKATLLSLEGARSG